MLEDIKILLEIDAGDVSQDNLLGLLIDRIKADIEAFCHTPYTDEMKMLAESMVVESFNKVGLEGMSNSRFTGALVAPTTNYSDNILAQLKSFRRIRTVK